MADVACGRELGPGPVSTGDDWPPAPAGALRVLVVEEDAGVRELLEEVLTGEGYQVAVATAGVAALAALEACPPDAIVLDLMLPDVDGLELAREYRSRPGPHAPIVALTTQADERQLQDGGEAVAETLVHMPFDLDVLLDALRRAASSTAGAVQRQKQF